MGGKAFESHGIATPRMPTKVYRKVLEEVEKELSTLFQTVAHAIEGPEKTSHGDLDVLFVPYTHSPIPSVESIAQTLGAVKWTKWQGNGIAQFAIPWPEDDEESGPTDTLEVPPKLNPNARNDPSQPLSGTKPVQKCIQLDLNQFSTPEDMNWQIFNTAHGDLCNIISNMIRSKGFTINTDALYLRIASAERYNRKAGRIQLSRDPEQVLTYLGLDTTRFWQPFSTLDEMMTYAATCRFFRLERQRVDNSEASMNWTDQKYLNSRPIFKYWIDTFLPAHKHDKPGKDAYLTREQALEDVYTFFGDHIRTAYETQKQKADTETARQFLWPNVRSAILQDTPDISENDTNDTIRALKRVAQYRLQTSDDQYTTIHTAFRKDDYETVISWCAKEHKNVLAAYRAGELEVLLLSMNSRQQGKRSAHDVESYTAEDDETIKRMKSEGAMWPEILRVLGKESKSQLQEHYKVSLQGSVDVAE